jgi:hypothetical protein
VNRAMEKGADGLPDPTKRTTFVADAASPVDLQIGPSGDLFYVDFGDGTIRRVRHFSGNQPPTAVASANPSSGDVPLSVTFDGTGSSDPDSGDMLTYSWDLDGDGVYDDSTSAEPSYTYDTPGNYVARLRVSDSFGQSATDSVNISAGNAPPTATIDQPLSTTAWKVNDVIDFSGSAIDPQDGTLPASSLSWSLIMHHCSSADNCHEHFLESFDGVTNGSFTAPDHEYPSYLELQLTATDSLGSQDTESVWLDPQTVELTFRSKPSGLQLVVGSTAATTPFSRTVIVGSKNSVSAPSPQRLRVKGRQRIYKFASWSEGGAQSHDIIAPAAATEYIATYRRR